ncbi:MAG: phytanoyl-CoA dioxygenase family protein [Myxococcaceae bacterium]|nr:phytanoyl-CoA dioxygenase family protein [Myxococcaceae bacterium]
MKLFDASRTVYHRSRERLRSPRVLFEDWAFVSARERALLTSLKSDGFAMLPSFYTAAECEQVIAEVRHVFETRAPRLWRSKDGADTRAFAAETVSARIRRFNRDPLLLRLGEKYLHETLEPFFTMAGHLRPTDGNLGSGGGWHRDTAAEHQFKALVYLTDTTEQTGAFQYVPGSHRLRSLVRGIVTAGAHFGQHRFEDAEVARICAAAGTEPRTFAGAAGTLLLVDSSGIHRGMPIATGERYALTTYYFSPEQVASCWRNDKFVSYFVGEKEKQ